MMTSSWVVLALSTLFCGLAVAQYVDPPNYGWGANTKFDEYINRPDDAWTYEELTSYRYENMSVTLYILNMTSQRWMSPEFTSCHVWWHFMGIAIPDTIDRFDIATLYIMAGLDNDEPVGTIPTNDSAESRAAVLYAADSRTIGAYIMQVPNQPCVFYNDPTLQRRSEDDVIAWTWRTFIDNYQSTEFPWYDVPIRNPMTKAAMRGLDTIAAFGKEKIPAMQIVRFISVGASKRGWTAWSTAYGDPRVVATSPEVFSLIHMEESVMAHYQALGGAYSFALEPYYELNLTEYLTAPVSYEPGGLFDYEDPYRYRARLTQPKLSIAAAGDEFFLCQDFNYWFKNMSEPKYLMMNPNAEHALAPHYPAIYETTMGFYLSVLHNEPMPKNSWTITEFATGSEIVFYTDPNNPPEDVRAFWSETLESDERRDYRLFAGYPDPTAHPALWRNDTVEDRGNGVYVHWLDKHPNGTEWRAHFIEGLWRGHEDHRIFLTTQVAFTPEVLPVPKCDGGAACKGYLT